MRRSTTVRLLGCLGLSAALLSSTATVRSQDPSLGATYGSVRLQAGFTPDPYTVGVTSGGNIQTNLGGVRAWVANAPDFKLNYTAGSLPLIFRAESRGDATLLINGPDGRWYANDDSNGLNPQIRFNNPQSGRYDIWVGSIPRDGTRATLFISEIR